MLQKKQTRSMTVYLLVALIGFLFSRFVLVDADETTLGTVEPGSEAHTATPNPDAEIMATVLSSETDNADTTTQRDSQTNERETVQPTQMSGTAESGLTSTVSDGSQLEAESTPEATNEDGNSTDADDDNVESQAQPKPPPGELDVDVQMNTSEHQTTSTDSSSSSSSAAATESTQEEQTTKVAVANTTALPLAVTTLSSSASTVKGPAVYLRVECNATKQNCTPEAISSRIRAALRERRRLLRQRSTTVSSSAGTTTRPIETSTSQPLTTEPTTTPATTTTTPIPEPKNERKRRSAEIRGIIRKRRNTEDEGFEEDDIVVVQREDGSFDVEIRNSGESSNKTLEVVEGALAKINETDTVTSKPEIRDQSPLSSESPKESFTVTAAKDTSAPAIADGAVTASAVAVSDKPGIWEAHYGLFLTVIILFAVCIVVTIVCLLCMKWRERDRQGDKAQITIEEGHAPPTEVSNPIPDTEMVKDEIPMQERENPAVTPNGGGQHISKAEEDNGWVVPIDELSSAEKEKPEVENTKL